MNLFEALLLGSLGLAVLLLILRMMSGSRTLRLVLALFAGLLLGGAALVIAAAFAPGPLSWVTPYSLVGTAHSTDLGNRECSIEVYSKALSNVTPPGSLPRVKLIARSRSGTATTTFDSGWRFWVGNLRPVPGGIEIYHSYPHGSGVRFLLKDDQWILAEGDVLGVENMDLTDSDLGATPEDLSPLVQLIHQSPSLEAAWFNPTALVRAVNALQSEGKEKAIRSLRAYHDLARTNEPHWIRPTSDRILPILDLLFIPEAGAPERPRLREQILRDAGAPRSAWPLFPIILVDDLPFLPVPHAALYANETPDDVPAAIEYASTYGVLREKPLAPRIPPTQAVETLLGTPEWKAFATDGNLTRGCTGELLIQALIATHTICPVTVAQYNALERETTSPVDQEWWDRVDKLRTLAPKWDERIQDFVAGNQTRYP